MDVTRTTKLVAPALVTGLLLVGTAGASAKTPARCTVPKLSGVTLKIARGRIAHDHCRVGTIHRPKTASGNLIVSRQVPKAGRKVRRGSRVTVWLRVKTAKSTPILTAPKPTPSISPSISYSTGVDPTFTQSPTDPLDVTYTYDASAVQSVGGVSTNLATTGSLPAGILNFYSGTALVCSMNVGAATSSGTCAITYPATGTYQVTTQYIPTGATAVTETDTETISPVPASTVLGVAFGTPFTYLDGVEWIDGFDANYALGGAPSFTLRLTDETTGVTYAGTSSINPSAGCGLIFFEQSSTIETSGGCGLPGFAFNAADTVVVTASTPDGGGFLGSTSLPTEIR